MKIFVAALSDFSLVHISTFIRLKFSNPVSLAVNISNSSELPWDIQYSFSGVLNLCGIPTKAVCVKKCLW
jgi:hypothetical protein